LAPTFVAKQLKGELAIAQRLTEGVHIIFTTPTASPKGFGTSPFMRSAQKGGGKIGGVRGEAPSLFLGDPFRCEATKGGAGNRVAID